MYFIFPQKCAILTSLHETPWDLEMW